MRNVYLICCGMMLVFALVDLILRDLPAARDYIIMAMLMCIAAKLERIGEN